MAVRSFSSQFDSAATRSIDNDAPSELRQEFIDAVYLLFERLPSGFKDKDEQRLHNIVMQSLGIQPSGNPYGGYRYAVSRDVAKVPWQRFYDLIVRVSAEIPDISRTEYRLLVNRLLAAYRIAWQFEDDDRLHRVVPEIVSKQMESAFRELSQPRFSSSIASFQQAIEAYDDRPQRGKDACKNIFDALESVAKVVGNMQKETFGDVVKSLRQHAFLTNESLAGLQNLYTIANNHFRHGTMAPFALKPIEVDYFLTSCIGAMLLFVRI